jgi:hypothetical protein
VIIAAVWYLTTAAVLSGTIFAATRIEDSTLMLSCLAVGILATMIALLLAGDARVLLKVKRAHEHVLTMRGAAPRYLDTLPHVSSGLNEPAGGARPS